MRYLTKDAQAAWIVPVSQDHKLKQIRDEVAAVCLAELNYIGSDAEIVETVLGELLSNPFKHGLGGTKVGIYLERNDYFGIVVINRALSTHKPCCLPEEDKVGGYGLGIIEMLCKEKGWKFTCEIYEDQPEKGIAIYEQTLRFK